MKNVLKWIAVLFGALILIAVSYGGYIYWQAGKIMSQTFPDVKGKNIYVQSDSTTVARGKHLVHSFGGCAACHKMDLGGESIDMGPFANWNVPNITQGVGGLPASYSIQDLDLIVRHGIKRDKTGSVVMPSYHFRYMADEDLAAIYAYLKVAPKVNRENGKFEFGPIGKMVMVKGGIVNQAAVIDHNAKNPSRPEIAPTAEYGKYLTEITCIGCHGPNLTGGPVFEGDPDWPHAFNLTKISKSYTHDSFQALFKTGLRPDGTMVDTTAMEPALFGNADSVEVAALSTYLSKLPEKPDASSDWPTVLSK